MPEEALPCDGGDAAACSGAGLPEAAMPRSLFPLGHPGPGEMPPGEPGGVPVSGEA